MFSEPDHGDSTTSGDKHSAYGNLNELTAFRRGTLSSSGNNGSTLDTVSISNVRSGGHL